MSRRGHHRSDDSGPADAALVEEYLAGEDDAVERVERWCRYAVGPFRRRIAASDLDDVVQDVLLRVLRSLRENRFRGDSSFETFVRRAASNACIDRIRRARRWRTTDLENLALRSVGPSPSDRAVDRDRLEVFTRVLAELPGHCRQLWEMVLDGRSYEAISERVGVSAGALRVRLLRCRRRAEELCRAAEAPVDAARNAEPPGASGKE